MHRGRGEGNPTVVGMITRGLDNMRGDSATTRLLSELLATQKQLLAVAIATQKDQAKLLELQLQNVGCISCNLE